MADPTPAVLPPVLREITEKALRGADLSTDEVQRLLAFSLVRMVQELEHVCDALRLTPDEVAGP